MPVKEPPAKASHSVNTRLKSQKNPHIDVHTPTSVECYPMSKGGAVTFDNNPSSQDFVVTVIPPTLFGCSDFLVKANHSVTKPVKVEACEATYIARPASLFSQLLSDGTDTIEGRQRSEPKDIIVP